MDVGDNKTILIPERSEPSSSAESRARLVEHLGRKVMTLEAEKSAIAGRLTQVHLQAEAEKSALAAQMAGLNQAAQQRLCQVQQAAQHTVAYVQQAAAQSVAVERALRTQAERMIPPEDPMVLKGGKKFAQPKSLAEWKERDRRDKKIAKDARRKKRKLEAAAQGSR